MNKTAIVLLTLLGLVACSGPRPILYPNAHLEAVGSDTAQRDIAECRHMAEAAGATPERGKGAKIAGSTVTGAGIGAAGGAVGGAVVGAAGSESGIGGASCASLGLVRGLRSSPKHSQRCMHFVDHCGKESGL